MNFPDSFAFGSSTFDSLESQVNRAINEKEKSTKKTDVNEVILESPKEENLTRTRSRLFLNSNSEKNKRNWRKSKSDSKLIGNEAKSSSKNEHYTQFFQSDFAFSMQDVEQLDVGLSKAEEAKRPIETKQHVQESVINVSQFEAAFDDDYENNSNEIDNRLVSAWELPICSEDVQSFMQTEEKNQESGVLGLQLSNSSELNLTTEKADQPAVSKPESEAITANDLNGIEDIPNLDATSFMCPVEDELAKENLQMTLEASKLEISKNHASISINTANRHERSQRLKKLTQVLSQNNHVSPKRTAPVQDLESLKLISAWGLPNSVLAEYEKKGIRKMFDWQIKCLSNSKVLFEHCNLVYSAPTSAGKTLVSEILLLKTVLERNKKVLLILPFISVVREKMSYLQDLLTPAGYRVEGFFGGYTPPGGFESIHVAICTIEKANSIVNKLLEQSKLDCLGTVVVDEVHLISDPGRGYILELLLAKILYMSRKYGLQIQIITMSATLANVELLKRWLDAELFITNFRPVALQEMIKVGTKIYDSNMCFLRDLTKSNEDEGVPVLNNDTDNVAQLCLETVLDGCSIIIFCPSKDWCEKLSIQLASIIHGLGKSGTDLGMRLRQQLKREAIDEVKRQLREIPTGLDTVLEKTITFGCAFHHAGLTTEERDIVEASFKNGALKIIVATSTLSSGVNLPARRVLIRTPLFGGKQMSSLTYKQMIGRAGRTGKDTLGESILICTEANARTGRDLVSAELKPITSCLELDGSTHLKRALLEVISSGVANTKQDINLFVNCTLLSAQKLCHLQEKDSSSEGDEDCISSALEFLIEYEFVRLQNDAESGKENYVATRLGLACLASSMPPTDGLILFTELQKCRRCFVLESELHAVYLVTPYSVCYQMQEMDWLFFLDLWEKLSPAMRKVGELVGVKESFLVRAMRGQTKLDYKLMQVHKRFYTALALQELVNETPINVVAQKYKCTRGLLQSLQQMAATFAGIVTAFCNALQWDTLSLIVSQFKERLFFGIHRDLIDLMRLPNLSHKRARVLFDAGITSLIELANADVLAIEKVLHNSLSFDSAKQHENENSFEAEQRNKVRIFFITGKAGLTVAEAAKLLINEARQFVEYEVGAVGSIKWTQEQQPQLITNNLEDFHMSCEENGFKIQQNKRKSQENDSHEMPIKQNKKIPKGIEIETQFKKVENEIEAKMEPKVASSKFQQHENEGLYRKENSKTIARALCNPEKDIKILSLKLPVNKDNESVAQTSNEELLKIKEKENKVAQLQQNVGNLFDNDFENKLVQEKAPPQKTAIETTKKEKPTEKVNNLLEKPTSSFNDIQLKNKKTEASKKETSIKKTNTKIISLRSDLKSKRPMASYNKEDTLKMKPITSNTKQQATAINSTKNTPKILQKNKKFQEQPTRRSPRNHASKTTVPNQTKTGINDSEFENIFANEETFTAALAMVEPPKLKSPTIPTTETASDEIPSSQNMENEKTQRSITALGTPRLLRSYRTQRMPSPLALKSKEQTPLKSLAKFKSSNDKNDVLVQQTKTKNESSSNLTDVDLSLESVDSPYIMQMNASHILSCTKEEHPSICASSFNAVEIIDMCGNLELFKLAIQEILEAKRIGFCLGLEQLANKKKPLIGANLLINQIETKFKSTDANTLFQIDEQFYLAGVAFYLSENIVFYMNLQTVESNEMVPTVLKQKFLQQIFHNSDVSLIIYETRKQLKLLRKAIPQIDNVKAQFEDPKIANWLLQPDIRLSLKQLAQQYAPECSALVNLCGGGRGDKSHGIDASSAISAKLRCCIEACVVLHILQGQTENLERIGSGELRKFFHELEMPIQVSLANMETVGFPANETALRDLFQKMMDTSKKLEEKIFSLHGKRFNLGSTQAVGLVLGLCRKSNGRVRTSRQVLEKIDDPLAQLIIAYRKLSVIMAKNIQPLLQCVQNNRIHGQSDSFTSTGRISMKEPNLQNVAKDFDIDFGSERVSICCRRVFFPMDLNRCLVSADFCQLEMRVLAHMAKDPALLETMNSPNDVFTAIAAGWNNMKEIEVSEQLRNGTKQICYGIIYGMGMRALADALKCSEDEAIIVSEQFHQAYPAIRVFTRKIVDFARRNGYVETIQGRKRYLENINSSLSNLRSQAERQAVNSAIQGSAADIAKRAILRAEKSILKYSPKLGLASNDVQFVLHVHDELIFEVPSAKAKKIAKIISLTMETCTKLDVPLKVTLKVGRNWGEMKELHF